MLFYIFDIYRQRNFFKKKIFTFSAYNFREKRFRIIKTIDFMRYDILFHVTLGMIILSVSFGSYDAKRQKYTKNYFFHNILLFSF